MPPVNTGAVAARAGSKTREEINLLAKNIQIGLEIKSVIPVYIVGLNGGKKDQTCVKGAGQRGLLTLQIYPVNTLEI